MPLSGGDGPRRPGHQVRLGDLAPLLHAYLPDGDAVRAWADVLQTSPDLAGQPLRGYLTGSVDVVLRTGGRYLVVDYKTNWLGPFDAPLTAASYRPEQLTQAMGHSSYPLQAVLYAVVAHRFLRWRLPGYDPEQHLGGVLYLYVRGMCGPDTPVVDGNPCGVFSWRPPAALVEAISDLLDGVVDEGVSAMFETTNRSAGDRRRAVAVEEPWARSTLLSADVHVARTLARSSASVTKCCVAAAFATRCCDFMVAVDLETLPEVIAEAVPDLSLPESSDWLAIVAASRLVTAGALVVDQGMVYLQRYHHQEVQVVDDLQARAALDPPVVDEAVLRAGLARIFPGDGYAEQRAAADVVARSRTSIITGGPGTGKTTTVAGVLALLAEQAAAAGERPLRVGLAAPTGKAAARMKVAVSRALTEILDRTPDPATRRVIEPLDEVEPMTLHRLLGWRRDSRTRFRHHRTNRLPHDVVLVDEASMVSLTHMARLLEALRPTARLILVGDADQLVSVDAGAVLADLVAGVDGWDDSPVALTRLRTVHRFGATIGTRRGAAVGDADAVVAALSAGSDDVEWVADADPIPVLRPISPVTPGPCSKRLEPGTTPPRCVPSTPIGCSARTATAVRGAYLESAHRVVAR